MNWLDKNFRANPTKLTRPVLGGLLLASGLLTQPACAAPAQQRPNIVIIMADDMGYSDLGCYGSEISTPNLDALAKNGVRFTQFYNTARCCPTRASLLTGLYPHQAGVGHMTDERQGDDGQPLPGYSGHLNDKCVTIAEALHSAGYFTAMTGKWHVGQNLGVTPWGRGFDRNLTAAAGGFYFAESPNARLFLNGQPAGNALPKQWYSTDLWTDYGLKFIDEARTEKKPFFLYVGENAPHFPLQAPKEDIARWRGKYKAGWDKLRAARYQRQLASGLIDKNWPLSPRPEAVPAWDSLTPEQQDRYDNIMAIYAAVLEHMDSAIGRLVNGLKERGELDNTLILFLSDNGGNAESGVQGRLEGTSPGDAQSTVFVGQTWATVNNTPFVRYKHYTDEGGISTPLIAHWPQGIAKTRSGQLEKQPGHVSDLMATCLDVAGATYPKEFKGKAITPTEGTSLRPAFNGQNIGRKNPIFWEHEGNRAVREGDWKLVALENQPWRLYNLAVDRTEQKDLAAAQPDRTRALAAKWDAYAARTNVLPLGGWRGSGGRRRQNGRGANRGPLSKETRFVLKKGDHLERAKSPAIMGHDVTLTVKFTPKSPNGVIVAQGGRAQGYTLFLKDGKLTFLVRVQDTITQVAIPETLTGTHTAIAKLGANGQPSLSYDGKPAITAKALSSLTNMPTDGLDVGSDEAGLIGPYERDNSFDGEIESVLVELGG